MCIGNRCISYLSNSIPHFISVLQCYWCQNWTAYHSITCPIRWPFCSFTLDLRNIQWIRIIDFFIGSSVGPPSPVDSISERTRSTSYSERRPSSSQFQELSLKTHTFKIFRHPKIRSGKIPLVIAEMHGSKSFGSGPRLDPKITRILGRIRISNRSQ